MTIENTSKTDPLALLAEAMVVGPEATIVGMEARGGQQMAASDLLPTEILYSTEADFAALGFVFGEVVEDDPLFRHAILPDGWKKKATGHNMWTRIVDERGFERAAIFYKAAWYDRVAHMSLGNVGFSVASSFEYESQPVPWDQMTAVEAADAITGLRRFVERCEESPKVYDKDGTVRPRLVAEIAKGIERLARE